MKIKMVAKSDVGKVRQANEDYCGIFEEEKLAIVCDGMGGHKAGSEASRLAVSTFRYAYSFIDQTVHEKIFADLNKEYQEHAGRLVSAIRLANKHIYNRARKNEEFHGMGTTISAILINSEGIVSIAHVGDSRVYRIRENNLEQLTEDHSWINELIQDKEIRKEDAVQFEKKNVITRALGLSHSVKIDLKLENIESNDIFLLCSDGLTDMVPDEKILQIVLSNHENLEKTAQQLIYHANNAGGADNISVALVKIEEHEKNGNLLTPVAFSLKKENDNISTYENRILKQEFNSNKFLTSISNNIIEIWEKKLTKVAIIAIFLIITCLVMTYSFTRNNNTGITSSSVPLDKIANDELEKAIAQNTFNKNPDLIKSNQSYTMFYSDSATTINPDLENELNKHGIDVKPLNKESHRIGQIYIVGIEKLSDYQNTLIYINNRFLGNTIDFIENGIRVRPGSYKLSVMNSKKKILFQAENIKISAGDIKALEIKTN